MKKIIVAAVAMGLCGVAPAEEVLDKTTLTESSSTEGISLTTAETAKQTAYPEDVGTPIFWIDCSQTNGWTFADEDGKLTATKVTSRSASVRYLSNDLGTDPFPFSGWSGKTIKAPLVLTGEAGLNGMPVLDFGPQRSLRGLAFNTYAPGIDVTASNTLSGIGTIIAVYGSQNGGGFFMGGGFAGKNGYDWHRSENPTILPWQTVGYDRADVHGFMNAVAAGQAYDYVRWAAMWHDGVPSSIVNTGYSGDWETLTFDTTAAKCEATGVGLGDTRASDFSRRTGGMKIAEMLIFGETLTRAQQQKVEAYLQYKWLGRKVRGWNSNVNAAGIRANGLNNGSLVPVTLEATAGETLHAGEVRGGSHATDTEATLTIQGAGKVALGDASAYGGTVVLRGGTLLQDKRAVPENPPTNFAFRLDASLVGNLTLEEAAAGVTNVTLVANTVASEKQYYGQRLYLSTLADHAKPTLRANALGAGKHAFDFGAAAADGAAFQFVTNETARVPVTLTSVGAVVAVVGAQEGGGNLADAGFRRYDIPTADTWKDTAIFKNNITAASGGGKDFAPTDGLGFLDGTRLQLSDGTYATPGYQVLAVTLPEYQMKKIGGATENNIFGGLRIAEMIVYQRPLDEEELKDASAYLMQKWFGRTMTGYRPAADSPARDVQEMRVETASTIDVAEGDTLRVGKLDLNAPLVKTGAGTLTVTEMTDAREQITLRGGTVTYETKPQVADADAALPAASPSLHLDATATGLIDTYAENGTNFVRRWYDAAFRNTAYRPNSAASTELPWLNGDAAALLNGKPVIDFGTQGAGKAWLSLRKGVDAVKSVYIVWGTQNGGGFVLGSSQQNDGGASTARYDFHRGMTSNGGIYCENTEIFGTSAATYVYKGTILTNGVLTTASAVPGATYLLLEVHPLAPAHIGALMADRETSNNDPNVLKRRGGGRIAELIAYERELTDREKVATRNYLMAKWFGKAAQALPEEEETPTPTLQVAALEAETDSTAEINCTAKIEAQQMTGGGTLEKNGTATLEVADISPFTGTVNVNAGTLKLTNAAPDAADAFIANGCIFHVDAHTGVTTATQDGAARVTAWESTLGDGHKFVPYLTGDENRPTYHTTGFNGNPYVELAAPKSFATAQCLHLVNASGAHTNFMGVYSAFFVLGTQDDASGNLAAGIYMYDYMNDKDKETGERLYTMREGAYTRNTTDNYWFSLSADSYVRWGMNWYQNGVFYPYTRTPDDGLGTRPICQVTGDWEVLGAVARNWSASLSVEGIGYNESTVLQENTGAWKRAGGKRLAEVILYNRILSTAEREQMERYINARWNRGVRKSATNTAQVNVAAGATLDCTAAAQYVGTLTGAGTVTGTIAAGGLAYDYCAPEEIPNVTGTFAVPAAGLTVDFRNMPNGLAGTRVRLLNAAAFADTDNLARVSARGVNTDAYRVRLYVLNGALWAAFSSRTTVIIVR